MSGARFTIHRVFAMLGKEFIQMRRDRTTLAMLVGIPLMQLFLFGYAINMVPRHLPTAMIVADDGSLVDSIVSGIANSSYFDIGHVTYSRAEARKLLAENKVAFAIEIPTNFSRDLVRGSGPSILVEADATDPAASSYAVSAITGLATTAMRDDLKGPLAARASAPPPFSVAIHNLYNPEANTQFNVVPGLLGIILTMTMVMATSISLTRERERGTYENLLAMPARPLEIMIGKITPNIFVGAFQAALILGVARFIFHVPMLGDLTVLAVEGTIYITALLAVGYTISTIATNQMQAMQMTFFFFMPSILLSGFAFPFRGMPGWAQAIGEVLPITHFLRIVRGVLLKGNGWGEVWPDTWPMLAFLVVAGGIAISRFRQTLD
ncbi:ABC-2 type transport system permease protein [Rhizomicrobium palustre]|uniref:ABC-2 type transport system permease protein n=1 Tax=Rhizomicrobium palustre TaxID=189966 RepID=A0A846MYX2_9PROT|nr:ABC transporter permease [Rhizomicrobium palustre]NIK88291.1 ABC-2 type transport system permease protein [Rhizomicrobium palustre]